MIPGAKREGMRIFAYPFRGYWRDVSSLKDYFDANLDMARVSHGYVTYANLDMARVSHEGCEGAKCSFL